MAVETRYVVVRNGEEVKTFVDKKSADEYDRMLDMAAAMSDLVQASGVKLKDDALEELGVYLATQREEVLYALHAKKRPVAKKPKAEPENDA
ncbi:YebG family protein [Echinimonas agarilytica]|uniref:YebG family protein n=1 Tax=Echinimonas agarilytica TaxID=1215918 RepID=A0AA42B6L0_9GAMM|nr:YebG family protein [Echinimonas agarilytica]MCM2678804.1 YebG family protein [Echinimonas agarilytica]